MRAVDALMECLKAEGVDVVFGLPGRCQPADLRRVLRRRDPQHPGASRGRRRSRGRGLREGDRQGRRVAGHQRPGRDQPGDPDLRRDDGLGPGRVHHRPGPDPPARHRRLPGGGHDRDHDADRQAQLHDPAPERDPAHGSRGVPRRAFGPSRAGGRRHPVRPEPSGHPLRAGPGRAPARLPADHDRQPEADPAGREGAGERSSPGDLCRRRRRLGQRVGRSWSNWRPSTSCRSPAR